MRENKVHDVYNAIDNAVFSISREFEVKTLNEQVKAENKQDYKKQKHRVNLTPVIHYATLVLLGVLSWALLWCNLGDNWSWGGPWFRIAAVAVVAWGSGQVLLATTTLPPLIAALLTGILARNLDILDMRDYTEIDAFLRKVYPVIILGKASLGWDMGYMSKEWKQVLSLGVLPWTAEVAILACCVKLLFGFPWVWGFLLGSFYASVSCAVVMPSVVKQYRMGMQQRNWPQLVCTAGGIDTALSVGVYGLVYSFMFSDCDETYKYIKASTTLIVGVALGVLWGSLAKIFPHQDDNYVAELRVLFVLIGGLFGNFLTTFVGWSGAGGVAVLACNATAAMHWSRTGWKLNQNPAATTYRVIWSALEPMVFAYSGTFFVLDKSLGRTMLIGLAILAVCLSVRLVVAWFACWNFTYQERIYVCCTWIPKSIVEAVLCPVAVNTLLSGKHDDSELEYANNVVRLIIEAIVITTPIGYLLTEYLGPILRTQKHKKDIEADHADQRRKSITSETQSEVIYRL